MDTLLAARLQMALSLIFHMIFAAAGIGLPLLLVFVEGLYLRRRQEHYRALAKKWAKATGLLFAVGAVSGTALAFELGLLWPRYMELTGAVVGHLFALEGFAFFVEAIFLGLYLYGWDRLSPWGHWWCAVVIALSGLLSGVLVLGVNAWMQVPVGYLAEPGGRVVVTDPVAIFKRYGWLVMAVHSTLSCYIAVPFAVAAVYARGLLRGRDDAYHRSAVRVCLAIGAVAAVLQPLSGDLLAKFVYNTQPAKFAAMEGQFETAAYAPARLGGLPDVETRSTPWAVEIPGLLSILAAHDPAAVVVGLNDIPRAYWPPVELTHLSFQVMVGCGLLLLALSVWFWLAAWRKQQLVFASRPLLWAIVLAGPLGFIALEAGWFVTEVGRQPWVIQGVMLTAEAVTPAESVPEVFIGFTVLYVILALMVVVLLRRLSEGRGSSGEA